MMVFTIRRALAALALTVASFSVLSAQQAKVSPALTTEQWRADLRALMDGLRKTHKNLYHATSQATFDTAVAALDARIPTMARHEIIAGFMKLVAMVGDGHTNIYPTRDDTIGFHTLPIALYRFTDGWYIRAADNAHADLVGARVVGIGAASIDDAYERIKPYIGRDNEMGVRFWAEYLLAIPEMLNVVGLSPSIDSARFQIESGGQRRAVWIRQSGRAPHTLSDTDASWVRRAGWVDARGDSPSKDPLWLTRRPDSTLWWFQLVPGTRIGYAQINSVQNSSSESFESFANRLLQFVDTARLDRLVIDLRLNRGGNGGLLKPLERGLLRRPEVNTRGRLYILEGRSTWSAAQFFVDDMESFSQALFVGEPSGSKGNTYGDSRQIKLPNSGITARASVFYWQDWHPMDTREWLPPDIAAELSFADYRANRDPALSAAINTKAGPGIVEVMEGLIERSDTTSARTVFLNYRSDSTHKYVEGHELLDQVAMHFYNNKRIPEATFAFGLAANQFPTDLRARLNVAAMYEESGNKEREAAELREALKLDPANAAVQRRLKVLAQPKK